MTQEREGAAEPRSYVAYLLRLWRELGEETTQWRASLQDPHSGDRVGFASLADLFGFLENETESGSAGRDRSDGEAREPPAKPD